MTITKNVQEYYAGLLGGYLLEAKGLIPKYDEMIRQGVELLALTSPTEILDIGSGVGNVERIILRRLPKARITCLEPSIDMLYASTSNLREKTDSVELLNQGVLEYHPEKQFDAIYSNSVLHNLPTEKKEEAVKRIYSWLKEPGVFVWGDFIRHNHKGIQDYFMKYRQKFALDGGDASDFFIEKTFKKEQTEDTPLTIMESMCLLEKVDFSQMDCVWAHDQFALFYAQK